MTPKSSPDWLPEIAQACNALPVPGDVRSLNARFLDRLDHGAEAVVLILPHDGRLAGYGLAFGTRQLMELREVLFGFVGPSYAWFPGSLARLDAGDHFEGNLEDKFCPQYVRFEVPKELKHCAEVLKALDRMLAVLNRTPALKPEAEVADQGSLRDFYLALRAMDRPEADRQLTALGRSTVLSDANLLGLRIELLATFQAWRELLGLPELENLLTARPAPALTQAILRAFYQERLGRHEVQGRFDLAREVFRTEVLPACSTLLTVRAGLDHPDCRRMFAYRAMQEQDASLREALVCEAGSDEERLALQALFVALAPPAPPPAPKVAPPPVVPAPPNVALDRAQAAYQEGDVDTAFELLAGLPVSFHQVSLLLGCASVMGTLAACRAALAALGGLPEAEATRLLRIPHNRMAHTQVESLVAVQASVAVPSPPANWLEWFRCLDNPDNLDLLKIARLAADEWPLRDSSDAELQKLVQEVDRNRPDAQRRMLLDALPHFLAAVPLDEQSQEARFRPLYQGLLTLLLLNHGRNLQALQLVRDLGQRLLEQGMKDETEYRQLIDDLTHVWEEIKSRKTLGWLLDVAEVVAEYPAPQAERERIVRLFTGMSPDLLKRLQSFEWAVLEDVCGLLGLQAEYTACLALVPAAKLGEVGEQATNIWNLLANQRVGIYSLETPSSHRAAEIIRRNCGRCQVILNHDFVATEPLRQLARTSDIVVMVVRAAQHAATNGILQERASRTTLRPSGKGSSSILRALEDHLRSLEPAIA